MRLSDLFYFKTAFQECAYLFLDYRNIYYFVIGLHRYVILLFKQSDGTQAFQGLPRLSNDSPAGRKSWNVAQFAAKYNLGNPVACNYFVAQWDPYVSQLYIQLSKKKSRKYDTDDLFVTF